MFFQTQLFQTSVQIWVKLCWYKLREEQGSFSATLIVKDK